MTDTALFVMDSYSNNPDSYSNIIVVAVSNAITVAVRNIIVVIVNNDNNYQSLVLGLLSLSVTLLL